MQCLRNWTRADSEAVVQWTYVIVFTPVTSETLANLRLSVTALAKVAANFRIGGLYSSLVGSHLTV